MARFGQHEPAVRVPRVAQQMLVAARVVEADDRTADERGPTEREEVVGRVVEQHGDVRRRAGGQPLLEQGCEPDRFGVVLAVRPRAIAEFDGGPVAEFVGVSPQQRGGIGRHEGRLPGGGSGARA